MNCTKLHGLECLNNTIKLNENCANSFHRGKILLTFRNKREAKQKQQDWKGYKPKDRKVQQLKGLEKI